jgi:hypothetical protein
MYPNNNISGDRSSGRHHDNEHSKNQSMNGNIDDDEEYKRGSVVGLQEVADLLGGQTGQWPPQHSATPLFNSAIKIN